MRRMTMGISPALFVFLRDLKENNNREWFLKNKERYEKAVKGPLLDFIVDFGEIVPAISPHISAIPRTNGGSLFRIYRDVRFSKDKTPYKTAAAVQFRHERGKDVHAPGYYLHLEPGIVFAGCGIWKPDGDTLDKIRSRIAEKSEEWQKLTRKKTFADQFTLEGDSLKRPPKGFDPDHSLITDLKRKDFIASVELNEVIVCQPDFLDFYFGLCQKAAPFMKFLTEALDLPW
jgi:uncharacterized protein (TIGR02453 family)